MSGCTRHPASELSMAPQKAFQRYRKIYNRIISISNAPGIYVQHDILYIAEFDSLEIIDILSNESIGTH